MRNDRDDKDFERSEGSVVNECPQVNRPSSACNLLEWSRFPDDDRFKYVRGSVKSLGEERATIQPAKG